LIGDKLFLGAKFFLFLLNLGSKLLKLFFFLLFYRKFLSFPTKLIVQHIFTGLSAELYRTFKKLNKVSLFLDDSYRAKYVENIVNTSLDVVVILP
jgi:hypothetical protein